MLGETIARPFCAFVPERIHPNHITLITHATILVLFYFSLLAGVDVHINSVSLQTHIILFSCAFLNFAAMVLDCLDGMIARARNKTSQVGEFLDHWFDAINTPLITFGVTHILKFSSLQSLLCTIAISGLYCCQLLSQNVHGEFGAILGVEGQLLTSFSYLTISFLYLTDTVQTFAFAVAAVVFVCVMGGSLKDLATFIFKLPPKARLTFGIFVGTQLLIYFHFAQNKSRAEYFILSSLAACSANGYIVSLNVFPDKWKHDASLYSLGSFVAILVTIYNYWITTMTGIPIENLFVMLVIIYFSDCVWTFYLSVFRKDTTTQETNLYTPSKTESTVTYYQETALERQRQAH